MNVIKNRIRELIGRSSIAEVEKVTGKSVNEACTRMKPGKADITGSFTSDVLLNAPD